MKLEYIEDISNGGNNKNVVTDKLVRLYNFDAYEAYLFREQVKALLTGEEAVVNVNELDFVERINCNLSLLVAENDIGITTYYKDTFVCELTVGAYQNMSAMLKPFVKNSEGYLWLYDTWESYDISQIGFLFSPQGSW